MTIEGGVDQRVPSPPSDQIPPPSDPLDPSAERGWLFLPSARVPEPWRHRAITVSLVPLLPDEAASVLSEESIVPGIRQEEEEVARLLARGLPLSDIARELGISRRTVDRRVAGLREHFSARSKSELATALAARGF